jgi:hypothetical protein
MAAGALLPTFSGGVTVLGGTSGVIIGKQRTYVITAAGPTDTVTFN